jgi:hypothetical protein
LAAGLCRFAIAKELLQRTSVRLAFQRTRVRRLPEKSGGEVFFALLREKSVISGANGFYGISSTGVSFSK